MVGNFDFLNNKMKLILVAELIKKMQQKNLNKIHFLFCDVLTPTHYCVLSSLP